MKKVFAIDLEGNIRYGQESEECRVHDKIAYQMYKDILENLNFSQSSMRLKKLQGFIILYANIVLISEMFSTLFVLESDFLNLVIIPDFISEVQYEWFYQNYAFSNKLMGAFSKKENDYPDIIDYEDEENSRLLVLEELNAKLQKNLGGKENERNR